MNSLDYFRNNMPLDFFRLSAPKKRYGRFNLGIIYYRNANQQSSTHLPESVVPKS